MSCIVCEAQKAKNVIKIEQVKADGIENSKGEGFAIVERANGTGYMWRELDSPDLERLKIIEYYIRP